MSSRARKRRLVNFAFRKRKVRIKRCSRRIDEKEAGGTQSRKRKQ